MSEKPTFAEGEAPGHIVRRVGKVWEIRWQARTDIVKRGFEPKSVQMWYGDCELTQIDRNYISKRCFSLQAEMLAFARGGLPVATLFDGTIKSLVDRYQVDPDSEFHKLRYRSQRNYVNTLIRITDRHGHVEVKNINARMLKGWHRGWTHGENYTDFDNPPPDIGPHIPMGHGFITHMRVLLSFGASILESEDCMRVRNIMRELKFPMGKPRKEILTAQHAEDIRTAAHAMQMPSIALAQAIQFEGTLRQRDVLGEWLPVEREGVSDVIYRGMKWIRGVRWDEVDQNFVLRHVTSKKQKEVVIELRFAPMVLEELRKIAQLEPGASLSRELFPASGPIVIHDTNGRPWSADEYRRKWRKIADAAGVPKEIKSMDTRAGAITEGASVADLDDVRHAATHAQLSQTANYSRDAAKRTAKVMKLRSENRNRTGISDS